MRSQKTQKVDFLVIGGGSAGVRAARIAAELGAKVCLIEEDRLGGTCVNVGCVPKKLYAIASQFHVAQKKSTFFGWEHIDPFHDWNLMQHNVANEIKRLNAAYSQTLEKSGVEIIYAQAQFLDAHHVQAGDTIFQADHILIATGSRPRKLGIQGEEYALTSNEFFHLSKLPQKVVIIGAGYIGVEFACILHHLGSEVTLVNRSQGVLTGFDQSTADFLAQRLEQKGIRLLCNRGATLIKPLSENTLYTHFSCGTHIEVDAVFVVAGRVPNTENLCLENADVALNENGEIRVDEHYRSSQPHIFALGDVIGGWQLTPVAINQAMILAKRLFGNESWQSNLTQVATAVFSSPEVATCGLSEEQALAQKIPIDIYESTFRSMSAVLDPDGERCYLKLIVHAHSQKVLGMHMVGESAAEMMQGFAVALNMGASKADFDRTVGIHPSIAEEWVTMKKASRSFNN